MSNRHGDFIWYELMTPDAVAARTFYEGVVGWSIEGAPSGPIDYRMITATEGNVAGLMPLTADMAAGGARATWAGYIQVEDVDAMIGSVTSGGGAVLMPASDIPGVGRIAIVADPAGAPFYIMTPASRADGADATSTAFSYDRPRMGHCAWNELSTSDVDGALHFYGQRFGWVKNGEMDMGEMGSYQFLRHAGHAPDGSPPGAGMLGAVMPMMPGAPRPAWTYYFRVANVGTAVGRIEAGGGTIIQTPIEIPGGEFSLVAADPQGAVFGLVGAMEA